MPDRGRLWRLVGRQHQVITHAQLTELGYSAEAIRHRLRTGRLHALHRGVYAVGRRQLPAEGRWMAAVLACGEGAVLSHGSAAALWGIEHEGPRIEVSVPRPRAPRPPGLRVHRRTGLEPADLTWHDRVPATVPARTLVDLAARLSPSRLEAAVNAADKLDRIDPQALRVWIARHPGQRGVAVLRRLLDDRTFVLTDSELERRFLPIARAAGLSAPQTGVRVRGLKLDFLWPRLGLVVETDGLRYHRTPSQQLKDRRRDQLLTAAGLTVLRFTHAQVAYEPGEVTRTLTAVARRLRGDPGGRGRRC